MALAHKGAGARGAALALHRKGRHRRRRDRQGARAAPWRPHHRRELGDRRIPRGQLARMRPSLFGGDGGGRWRACHRLGGRVVHAAPSSSSSCPTSRPTSAPEDAAYFTRTREARFGKPLAEVTANREGDVEDLRRDLHPLRMVLQERPWLSGPTARRGGLHRLRRLPMGRAASPPSPCWTPDDPVHAWRGRLLDAFGGLARRRPRAGPWLSRDVGLARRLPARLRADRARRLPQAPPAAGGRASGRGSSGWSSG